MENLFVDVVHSFKSFTYQAGTPQIQKFDRVFLCGSAARLPGIAAYLENRLGAPVTSVDALADIPFLPGQKKPETRPGDDLGIAAGLARQEVL